MRLILFANRKGAFERCPVNCVQEGFHTVKIAGRSMRDLIFHCKEPSELSFRTFSESSLPRHEGLRLRTSFSLTVIRASAFTLRLLILGSIFAVVSTALEGLHLVVKLSTLAN